MSLISSFISHQIWLQRNASHEANELQSFIQQMRDEVKAQVLAFGDDSRTATRLNKMLKDLDNILSELADGWTEQLTADLQDLAKYEADWTTKTLDQNVDAEFVTPSPEQVWSAVKFNPMALGDKPQDLFGMMKAWGDTEVNRLVMGVKTGFVQGLTTRQIVKNVTGEGGLADISERNAETVIKTAINHVSTQAKEVTYQKNSDIIDKYEWVSTLDSRTSTTCFTAETELAPIAGMNAIMRGNYSGEIFTVKLANGKEFSGTAEHPILTQYGWTSLNKLDPCEHIIYTIMDEMVVFEAMQNINMPARADDIFNTFANNPIGKMISTSPTATDFYGDGVRFNGEIDIVSTNCQLGNYVNTSSIKQSGNVNFRDVHSAGMLGSNSAEHLLFFGELPENMTAFNEVELFNETIENSLTNISSPDTFSGGNAAHKHFHRAALVGDSIIGDPTTRPMLHESELLEKCRNGCGCGVITLGDDASGNAITVHRTNIISINREFRTCHVYTLSSSQGYYTAGGAIVKNCRSRDGQEYELGKGPLPPAHPRCRSTTAPVISSEFDFLDKGAMRAARGAEGGQQVSADMSYYDFLKQQPAWFQDEALGPTRGKIFRNSGISPEEFRSISVDGFGRPLTLDEMAALDKRVADYLNK